MRLTSQNFYRLALLLPLVALPVLFPFFQMGVAPNSVESSSLGNFMNILGILGSVLMIMSIVYFMGVPYWLPPYMVLILFLWIWSQNKNRSQIYKRFMWSPFYLAVLMTLFYFVVTYFDLFRDMNYLGKDIASGIMLCTFPAPIVVGFLFIGMTAWIYDFFRHRGMIVDHEEEISPNTEGIKN